MKRLLSSLLVLTALSGPAWAGPAEDLDALITDVEAFERSEDPIEAGRLGDREALRRLPDVTPEADAQRLEQVSAFLARARAIDASDLSRTEQLNLAVLEAMLADRAALDSFDTSRIGFSSIFGFHQMPLSLTFRTVIRTPDDAEAWVARLNDVPRYFEDNIANLRRAIETGWTQPAITARQVLSQAETLSQGNARETAFFGPLNTLPDTWDADTRERIQAAGEQAITEAVLPAYERLAAFMRDEYLPAAREALAIRSVPGGEDYYRALARSFTTLDLTPEEIHETGRREVVRIRGEMEAIIEEIGFDGTFADFQAFLREDPQFYATTAGQLMRENAYVAKKLDRVMPEFFMTLPRLPYGVIPMPDAVAEGSTTAYYQPGDPVNGIAGNYVVNTTDLPSRPLFEIPVLTIHEGVPGHHHQIALAQELEDVPEFRKRLRFISYIEGWALYTESLCTEIGACETPYEVFGMLSYEMWRACRLVADTGIHWYNWPRDQAEACFLENSALSEANIRAEVDRYISYPGQALAYKIGQIKIQDLRARAEEALGADFDIRTFHDALLLDGAVPLTLLEEIIETWIAEQQAAAQE